METNTINFEDHTEYSDFLQPFWDTLLKPDFASYSGQLEFDVLSVIKVLYDDGCVYYTKIAAKLEIDETWVQFILHLICFADLANYGSSPRGCWLEPKGKEFWLRFKPVYDFIVDREAYQEKSIEDRMQEYLAKNI